MATPSTARPLAFSVRFDPVLQSEAFSGRVYVIVGESDGDEPRLEVSNWFRPPRIFAQDVELFDPSIPLAIDGEGIHFPRKLSEVAAGEYRIQAIARRSLDHPIPGQGPSDLYSAATIRHLDPKDSGMVELTLTKSVVENRFEESSGVKLFEMVSPLLSRFHGREVKLRAAVVLPASWADDPAAKYPVLYMIPGFGGDHRMARAVARMRDKESPGHQVLFVVPDPTCYRGHSVFADSANNGPWGQALISELIPQLEKKFHGAQSGRHRYVTGASSGGWSALWLQVSYPGEFNGCWAHCPDPVDFRDFQRINLYAESENMFVDRTGARRPLARMGDRVMIEYEDFIRREEALGPGGQIRSFEAVFSRRGADGRPESFFDPQSGAVFTTVTRTWEPFDIRLVLERNWTAIESQLAGKLHVYAGGKDTFYLEGAVALLKESLVNLGSDAEVIIEPDMGHGMYRAAIEPMYETILGNFRNAP